MKISYGNHIYIHNQCSKIAHGNWALTNLRNYVNLSTLRCAYYGLIYPHPQYCSSLWGQASKTSLIWGAMCKIIFQKSLLFFRHI